MPSYAYDYKPGLANFNILNIQHHTAPLTVVTVWWLVGQR